MATVYSHSRLSCFENCPKQFHYRYVEKRRVDTESIEAFVGKRVHEVLERLNHFLQRGMVPSLTKVVARYRALWDDAFDAERVRIVRRENPAESYRELGERCLSNHYRRNYPFDRDETLGIEENVSFALDPDGRYRMRGIVDRVVRAADGALEIHDYKTGRWVPSQEKLDVDRQLALYQMGLEDRHGSEGPVRLVWHYLLRNQIRVSSRTRDQLDALRRDTTALIDRIEAERDYTPTPSSLCSWCEFNDECPAAKLPASPARQPAPTRAPLQAQPRSGGARSEPQASEVHQDASAQQPGPTRAAEPQASEVHQPASAPAPPPSAGTPASAAGSSGGARSEPKASEVHQLALL